MKRWGWTIAAIVVALIWLSSADDVPDYNGYGTDGTVTGKYFAIVGVYDGGETDRRRYDELGVYSLDECRSVARNEYNRINGTDKDRAFDWFCKNTHSGRIDR